MNLQLADEYGIYIGMSHHEQCMRAGEEYSHVRGADSIYGDAWDYRINPDGLLRFWEDGIRRSRDYRVMPTLGMRGERDSKMLEEGAPLSENVRLLKEIIQKQREMIKIHMEERGPVTKVFAVYKEVEEYYFGGKKGEGLAGDPGLEDVILLFCEDNFGNMRALPSAEDLKKHRGGFGMYYHLDYHGDPISYEWVASQPPIKIWDQMNKAWDHGIRDLWIVNAGDVKFQEYPLSFFMAFAYDREQFRESRCVEEHAENFVRDAFGRHQDASVHSSIKRVLTESLRLNFLRRPEALHSEILHPAHYGETDRMLSLCGSLEEENEAILQRLREEETEKTYYSTVYFPAAASLNLWKMHLFAGKNHLYASQGKAAANHYAGLVEACIERDRALSEDWRRFLGGKWSGMELASHIGFINWNDEDWRYPVRHVLSLPDRERLIVSKAGETKHFSNQYFPRPLVVRDFSESSRKEARIQIAAGGSRKIRWSLTDEKGETPFCPWLSFSVLSGETDAEDILILSVKTAREGNGEATKEVEKKLWRAFRFFIRSGNQSVPLLVEPPSFCLPCEEPGLYVEEDGTIRMDADGYLRKEEGECLGTCYRWEEIPRLGKQRMALRLHPSRGHFLSEKGEKAPLAGAPCLSYGFWLEKEGGYTVIFTLAAANPARYGGKLSLWVVAGQEEKRVDITGRDYRAGEAGCGQWAEAVLKQELTAGEVFFLEKGANRLRVIPSEAGVILERITVCPVGKNPPSSYLGGPESVRIPGWK